jgi:hypothetical protein
MLNSWKSLRKNPVTSSRKQEANRLNGQRSTGPRTASGKARVGQNSRKHGLSVPILQNDALAKEAHDLAHAMSDECAGRLPPEGFLPLCVAHLDLQRIALTRIALTAQLEQALGLAVDATAQSPEVARGLRALGAIERYERRAKGRQRTLLQQLIARVGRGQ